MNSNLMTNVKDYLNNIYSIYKESTQSKSISDTLMAFSQLSKNHLNVNNAVELYKYSDSNFLKCSVDEQNHFINDQLQLIETLVGNAIYVKEGTIWNFENILNLIRSETYYNTEKGKRKVVWPSFSQNRPIGEVAWDIWNGVQILDLDIKNEELASKLKYDLFNSLSKYRWFLGVYFSASRKSLHVWTKITPITTQHDHRKIEYMCNFRHKYSYIYIILTKFCDKYGFTKDDIIKFMDMAMAKPQQGIFIGSDFEPLINTGFNDERLDVNFEQALYNGVESINWISHSELKEIFRKLEWFSNDTVNEPINPSSVTNVDERDETKNKRIHYKHAQRWQIANTLVSLYGESKALSLIQNICSHTPYQELKGDIKTAAIHNKPISLWAVNILNKNHGFNIKLSNDAVNDEIDKLKEKIDKEKDNSVDPIKILNDNTEKTILYLRHDQYLSDIKDQILENLDNITLLEAGAGYGKTEMIKSLKDRTLLILPFTSTIKAKVESSEVTKDWLYYYGTKRPTFQELMGNQNMSMTIDKFSRLNLMELDQANFKYIVIDESHLLYTSSYRSVMSPTIQRLANCTGTKVIMMSGTPTGETLFFPNIKHIKVIKEDNRIKQLDIYLCHKPIDKIIKMADHIAEDILNGKKILYPSNDGNLFYEQIIGLIQERYNEKCIKCHQPTRKIKSFYYKKSNYGDETMDEIDVNKSIGPNDIICCSNYLSVGVDICDKFKFSIYFSRPWIAQDIEQFANRIRNNDLYIKLFLEKSMSDGTIINYNITSPLDLNFDNAEIMMMRDMIQLCNDMLERNEEESKYNPLVSSLLTQNTFLKYDENDCKYYIDETTYKLKIFEDRYSVYSKQLNVIISNMRYYGYDTLVHNIEDAIPDNEVEEAETLFRNFRQSHFNEQTARTFKFLHHINDSNIEIYKNIMKGAYNIFKDEEYREMRESNNLYVEDIETVLKNLPIYLKLYTFYDCDTIIDIYNYCLNKKTNKINYSQLERIKRFVTIEDNRKKQRIDFPIYKFILEAQKFAAENEYIDKMKLEEWIANYAAKIGNVVKNVVIDDVDFLEKIYDLVHELFDIIVIKKGTSKGVVHIKPFELLWERKFDLFEKYGNSIYTKEFFVEELINNVKANEEYNNEEYILERELPHTQKLKIDDIINILPTIVHKGYDYYTYSEEDGSNKRFLQKQENTKRDVFVNIKDSFANDVVNELADKTGELQLEF